jgi:transcriptional regulator with XRE-family HTH domain
MSTEDITPAEIVRERFAARIRQEITAREWNQSDLAREASRYLKGGEVSRDNISNYINQKALPGPIILGALAKALDTTPEDLLPERGAPVYRGEAVMLPMTDVRDAGNNMAFLRINRRVPWPMAADIIKMIAIWTQSEAEADMAGAQKYYKS